MQKLTEAEFKEKVIALEDNGDETKSWIFKGDKPAVIDFYADWCGPCKMVSPIIEQLDKDFDGKIDFYKVDTEAEPVLARMFQIQSIPSILLISTEEDYVPQMILGAIPREGLLQAIEKEFGLTL
jgi:thioredoxin